MEQGKVIFIGGVGRSGTTPLAEALGQHPDIFTFSKELRFLTDPDGLVSLKSALVDQWSCFQADFAIERFKQLMKYLSTKYVGKYPTNGLKEYVSSQFYEEWVEGYLAALGSISFKSAWVGRATLFRKILLKYLGRNALTELWLERSYYSPPISHEEFCVKTNAFIGQFFQRAAQQQGKVSAVDHTPLNLIHADFLYQVLPDMKLIHVYRDPKDIAASFSTRDWGNKDLQFNFQWITDTYARWETVKQKIPSHVYHEVCFEEFIHDVEGALRKVADFIGVPFHPAMLSIDLSRHNIGRWKRSFSSADLALFQQQHSILHKYEYSRAGGV